MTPNRFLRVAALAAAGFLLLAAGARHAPAAESATDSPSATDAETAKTMAEIVATLEYLLPRSWDSERFSAPADRDAIRAHLRLLADEAGRLEAHGAGRDAAFGSLSRSFADDARLIARRYDEGRPDEARFLLHEITDSCVACHSRLPDSGSRPLGRPLADAPEVKALPLSERVRVEAATRQFDRALDSYEALFASQELSPADLDLGGYLDSYVELCLRVRRNPARPRRALQALLERKDIPAAERETLVAWVAALAELEVREAAEDQLAAAAALLAVATDRERFDDDRRALVYYVAASGELHRALAGGALDAAGRSEAYYGLGLVESKVGRAFWLSETEDLLEASIRSDPAGAFAEPAWRLLEEFLVSGYTGSAGGDTPREVRQRLAGLRELIDASRRP